VFGYKHTEGRGRLPEPGAGPGWAVVFVYVPVASATEGPASTSILSLRGDFGQMDRRSVHTLI